MNDRSSRSHQVLTVVVRGLSLVDGQRSHGCLHLVDLAGSERVGKSEATGACKGAGACLARPRGQRRGRRSRSGSRSRALSWS
jgi:hypothetical protein